MTCAPTHASARAGGGEGGHLAEDSLSTSCSLGDCASGLHPLLVCDARGVALPVDMRVLLEECLTTQQALQYLSRVVCPSEGCFHRLVLCRSRARRGRSPDTLQASIRPWRLRDSVCAGAEQRSQRPLGAACSGVAEDNCIVSPEVEAMAADVNTSAVGGEAVDRLISSGRCCAEKRASYTCRGHGRAQRCTPGNVLPLAQVPVDRLEALRTWPPPGLTYDSSSSSSEDGDDCRGAKRCVLLYALASLPRRAKEPNRDAFVPVSMLSGPHAAGLTSVGVDSPALITGPAGVRKEPSNASFASTSTANLTVSNASRLTRALDSAISTREASSGYGSAASRYPAAFSSPLSAPVSVTPAWAMAQNASLVRPVAVARAPTQSPAAASVACGGSTSNGGAAWASHRSGDDASSSHYADAASFVFPSNVGSFVEVHAHGPSRYSRRSDTARTHGLPAASVGPLESPHRRGADGGAAAAPPSPVPFPRVDSTTASSSTQLHAMPRSAGARGGQREASVSSLSARGSTTAAWRNAVPPLAKSTISLSIALHISDSAPVVRLLQRYCRHEHTILLSAILHYHPFFQSAPMQRLLAADSLAADGHPLAPVCLSKEGERLLPMIVRRYFRVLRAYMDVQQCPPQSVQSVLRDTDLWAASVLRAYDGPADEPMRWQPAVSPLSAAAGQRAMIAAETSSTPSLQRPSSRPPLLAPRSPPRPIPHEPPQESAAGPLTLTELRGFLGLTPELMQQTARVPLTEMDAQRCEQISSLQRQYDELAAASVACASARAQEEQRTQPLSSADDPVAVPQLPFALPRLAEATARVLLRGADESSQTVASALRFLVWRDLHGAAVAAATGLSPGAASPAAPLPGMESTVRLGRRGQASAAAETAAQCVVRVLAAGNPPEPCAEAWACVQRTIESMSWMQAVEEAVQQRRAKVEAVTAVIEAVRNDPNAVVLLWYNGDNDCLKALRVVVQAINSSKNKELSTNNRA